MGDRSRVLHLDCPTAHREASVPAETHSTRCTVDGGLDLGHSCTEIEPCNSWVEHSRADLSQDVRKENVGRNWFLCKYVIKSRRNHQWVHAETSHGGRKTSRDQSPGPWSISVRQAVYASAWQQGQAHASRKLQLTGCPLKRVTTGKCYSSSELAVGDKQVSLVANETSGGWESLDSFQMGLIRETKRSGKSGNWRFTSMSS